MRKMTLDELNRLHDMVHADTWTLKFARTATSRQYAPVDIYHVLDKPDGKSLFDLTLPAGDKTLYLYFKNLFRAQRPIRGALEFSHMMAEVLLELHDVAELIAREGPSHESRTRNEATWQALVSLARALRNPEPTPEG